MNRLVILCAVVTCLFSWSVLAQGPLTPPGAPAPTFKTLQQVEPRTDLQATPAPPGVDTSNASYHFIINQPGSYYLSANLGVTKIHGIQINAEGVTLDLNGFEISRASGTGGDGIQIVETAHRAGVRNGSIKGFANGIRSVLGAAYARGGAFRDLAVSGCTNIGILAGDGAVLESCRVQGNSGSNSIFAGNGCSLSRCTANNNTNTAEVIRAERGSTLSHCTASNNTAFTVIFANNGSTISDCTAHDNAAQRGIAAANGSTLINCSVYGTLSTQPISAGITVSGGCTVTSCSSRSNTSTAAASPTTGMGFEIGDGSTIQNCTATRNKGDGINVSHDCVVRENLCQANGLATGDGAGIHVTFALPGASNNRIEGNNVSGNDRGIDVDDAGNIIIKNTAKGNTTNYAIAANNVFGAIVDRTAPASAVVSGNSAASSAASTDPWANFAY